MTGIGAVQATFFAGVAVLWCVLSMGLATAEPAVTYPLVYPSSEAIREAGLFADDWADEGIQKLNNHCYYYGDGGWGLTVSDGLLEIYSGKGFSLHSLCLALVSEARYHPETGQRIPTALFVNETDFKAALGGRDPRKLSRDRLNELESGVVSDELPLVVPECFRNGTPLADCVWRYDIRTGRKIEKSKTARIKELGDAIDRTMKIAIAAGTICDLRPAPNCIAEYQSETDSGDGETVLVAKSLAPEGYGLAQVLLSETLGADKLLEDDHSITVGDRTVVDMLSFYDISPSLPKGFGYALNADGAAGPGTSVAGILAAHDGIRGGRRLSKKRLKEILGGANSTP